MLRVHTHCGHKKKIIQPYMSKYLAWIQSGLNRVSKNHKLSSCCPQASFGPLTEEGQATCIVTSGGEPKGGGGRLEAQLEAAG